jgi:hypothetical protein
VFVSLSILSRLTITDRPASLMRMPDRVDVRVSICLTFPERRQLEALARREGLSVSEVGRRAILRAVEGDKETVRKRTKVLTRTKTA